MKKNGFTLIELLVCFILITVVSISLFKTVIELQEKQQKNISQNEYISFATILNNSLQKNLIEDKIIRFTSCGTNCFDLTFQNRGDIRLSIDKENDTITYGSIKEKLPFGFKVYDDINIDLWIGENDNIYNSFLILQIPLKSNYENDSRDIRYIYQFNNNTHPITT